MYKPSLWLGDAAPAAAQRRPRLRGRRAPPEFHPGRGRARDDPGGGQLSNSLVGRAAWRAPVRAHQGAGVADRGRAPDRAAGRLGLRDAGRRLFGRWSPTIRRLLSISTAQTFATAWLAPRLGAFQIRHPDLAVRLSTDNRLVDFSTGEFHAAIRVGRGDWPGLKCHFLFRLHYSPICSAEFAAAHRLERPEQLLEVPRLSPADDWWASLASATWASRRARAGPIRASCSTTR